MFSIFCLFLLISFVSPEKLPVVIDRLISRHPYAIEQEVKKSIAKVETCLLDFDGSELPKYAPLIVDKAGNWVLPQHNDDDHSVVEVEAGSDLVFACSGTSFDFEFLTKNVVSAKCKSGTTFTIEEFGVTLEYSQLGCRSYVEETVKRVGMCGSENNYILIQVGFTILDEVKEVFRSCFDLENSRSIWAQHLLYDEIADRDTGTAGMPSNFDPDTFFPDFDVAHAYTKLGQRDALAEILDSVDLADDYIDVDKGEVYMARGHLSPRADFIYKSWQRASYRYINTAPQWQCFNGGNWNNIEEAVRSFVQVTPYAVVYTGTHGILQLKDYYNNLVDIWLSGGDLKQRLPVPRFYWKVIYDPISKLGITLIGVNNPHLPEDEISTMKICDEITDHPLILGLESPDDIYKGITYACTVQDAKKTIHEIPDLDVEGIMSGRSGSGRAGSAKTFVSFYTILFIILHTLANQI